MSRVHVCALGELEPGVIRVVHIARDDPGTPEEVLVTRDRTGAPRAYRNLCKHLPIPLDAGGRDFLADDKVHLICRTHGAVYRPEDGLCIEGPCRGERLDPVQVIVDEGEVYLAAAAAP